MRIVFALGLSGSPKNRVAGFTGLAPVTLTCATVRESSTMSTVTCAIAEDSWISKTGPAPPSSGVTTSSALIVVAGGEFEKIREEKNSRSPLSFMRSPMPKGPRNVCAMKLAALGSVIRSAYSRSFPSVALVVVAELESYE